MQPLNPDYVVGITDGEGCFTVNIRRWKKNKTGFSVSLCFCISIVKRDSHVLDLVKEILGCGTIVRKNKQKANRQAQVQFHVTNIEDIKEKIIPFFEKHPLIVKDKTFQLWKEALEVILSGQHRTKEGLLKVAVIRDQMNRRKAKKFTCEELKQNMG